MKPGIGGDCPPAFVCGRQCEGRREVRARLQAKWRAVKEFDARKEELQEVGDYLRSRIQVLPWYY